MQENQLVALPTGAAWPDTIQTIFLQDNKLADLPVELARISALARINLANLPLAGEGKTTAETVRMNLMRKVGGVFWGTDGRKMDSPA